MNGDEIVPYGKHEGKKWSEVPKTYLEYIVNNNNSGLVSSCRFELERRQSRPKEIYITFSAIDSASFILVDQWKKAIESDEFSKGFYSYLVAFSLHVLRTCESDSSGCAYFRDLIFKFEFGNLYPTLISVSKIPEKKNG